MEDRPKRHDQEDGGSVKRGEAPCDAGGTDSSAQYQTERGWECDSDVTHRSAVPWLLQFWGLVWGLGFRGGV